MNTSKILKLSFVSLFISIIGFKPVIGMEEKNRTSVYSHGFGESGYGLGPDYPDAPNPNDPDAPNQLFRACFYTKPAVHVLANYLKNKVDEGHNAIDLEARSCGVGTAINCLDKLVHYDKNPGYFDGTAIQSKADADAVVAAINNGSLDLTVPFLSLKKANAIAIPSKYLGYTGITAACYTAYRWGMFDKALEMAGINSTIVRNVASAVTTVAANYAFSSTAKNICATIIDTFLIPPITHFNYNPFHTKPINAVEGLREKITCPTLIHCCKQDRVIENPDKETIKFYDALRHGNEEKTHIILTDDSWHNGSSMQHQAIKNAWKIKHNLSNDKKIYKQEDVNDFLKNTQPSIQELRKQIYNPTHE